MIEGVPQGRERSARPTSLAWESPFFGRVTELESVVSLLQRGERLVSILGPPGMGKTRLARQTVSVLRSAGIACAQIDAAACRHVEQIRAELLLCLGGIEDPPDPGARDGVARTLAAAGPAVVLLDNLESMVDAAAPELESWLEISPALKLLVTSRVRLRLPAEIVVDLGPLDPGAGTKLFEYRARRAVSEFALRPGELATVQELVQRLDGLPLAIELAAARSRVYRPGDLLRRSRTQGEILGRDASSGPLASAIESSFDAVSSSGQRGLAYLSVLGTRHDVETIEAVISASGAGSAADVVEELVDASLLRSSIDEERDELGFLLYESVREFAAARLDRIGERDLAERALSDHLVLSSERLTQASTGPDAVDGLDRLARLREEMRRACERELATRPHVAARLALALNVLALARGPLDLQHALLGRVRSTLASPEHRALLARVDSASGYLCFLRGQVTQATEHLASAYRLAAEIGLGEVAAEASSTLMLTTQWTGRSEDASNAGVPARNLSAFALFTLGLRALHRGDIDSAGELLLRGHETGRTAGHNRDAARCLGLYGLTRHELGRAGDASALYDQATVELRHAGDVHFQAVIEHWRGLIMLDRGDLDGAISKFAEAVIGFQQVSDPFFESAARGYGGFAHLFARQPVTARDSIALTLPVLRGADDTYRLGIFLPLHAVACAELGDEPSARRALEEATSVAARVANPNVRAFIEVLSALVDLRVAPPGSADALQNAEACIARARGPMLTPSGAELRSLVLTSTDVRFALQLLERACRDAGATVDTSPRAEIVIAGDGTWFHVDGQQVDLRRRRALSLMLSRLAMEHERSPGTALSTTSLVAAGWPGERMLAASGANRVHVAIATLRRLGLGWRLARTDGGYLIPAEVVVAQEDQPRR